MKLKNIFAAALAAAVMATTTVMTASALNAETNDFYEFEGVGNYYWEGLAFKSKSDGTVQVFLDTDADSRYRVTDPVVIPETINGKTVTEIIGYAFAESNIPSLTIPKTVTTIGSDFITLCLKLTDIYFEGTEAQWKAINGGSGVSVGSVTVHFGSADSGDSSTTPNTPDGSADSGDSSTTPNTPEAPESTPVESTQAPNASTSSAPSTSDNDKNPNTGLPGVVLAFGAIVVVGAAVIVIRKRK